MRWAIGLAAATWILIGVVVVAVRGRHEASAPSAAVAVAERDQQLGRCRNIGEAAKDDVACRQAWAAARANFFGERRP